ISPSSPSVQVTSVTCAPSAAYLAIVAPVPIDSSSGCACTSSSRRPEITLSKVMVRAYAPAGTGKMLIMTESFPRQEARTRRFTRPDPAGRRLAYARAGALRVASLDSAAGGGRADDQVLGEAAGVTFGLAEFIAAEEMGRTRGYWWSPDGSALLAARVDETPVHRWHIADPANPERPPAVVAYPAAGTPNAAVSLVLARLDGTTAPVDTGGTAFPYLVTASWEDGHDPLVVVQSRDQRTVRLLTVDPDTGRSAVLREDTDPCWLEVVPGVPAWTAGGRLVWTA